MNRMFREELKFLERFKLSKSIVKLCKRKVIVDHKMKLYLLRFKVFRFYYGNIVINHVRYLESSKTSNFQ